MKCPDIESYAVKSGVQNKERAQGTLVPHTSPWIEADPGPNAKSLFVRVRLGEEHLTRWTKNYCLHVPLSNRMTKNQKGNGKVEKKYDNNCERKRNLKLGDERSMKFNEQYHLNRRPTRIVRRRTRRGSMTKGLKIHTI